MMAALPFRVVREWVGGSAVVLAGDRVLLVGNRRRNGSVDWTPPGGVIEIHDGEALLDGLGREVEEETGLRVTAWSGPLYSVIAEAPGLGWRLRAEIHLAEAWEGDLVVADPDGIVVDARFVDLAECAGLLDSCHPWVREPLSAWLTERWETEQTFDYRVDGADIASLTVTRIA
jgi:ADP-ribose pyrophosphatase YjhB (NUDIX family)